MESKALRSGEPSAAVAPPQGTPGRGRPRDVSRDTAIFQAALELLTEVGYDRLSIGAVAARAGVSKATIYRRWSNKAAVVAAAVEHRTTGTPPRTRGGVLREDLLEVLEWLADQISGEEIGLLAAVIAGMRSDADLAAAMRSTLRRDLASMIEQALSPAVNRGEQLNPHAAGLFAEIAPAVILHRVIIVGEPCDQAFIEHLVDDILLPLLRGP